MTLTIGAPNASAAPYGKTIQMTSSAAVAHCNISVTAVDPVSQTATVRMQADARPAGFNAYFNNTFTQVHCYLFGGTTLFAAFEPSARTNVNASLYTVVPYLATYDICGYSEVKRRAGNFVFSPTICG